MSLPGVIVFPVERGAAHGGYTGLRYFTRHVGGVSLNILQVLRDFQFAQLLNTMTNASNSPNRILYWQKCVAQNVKNK